MGVYAALQPRSFLSYLIQAFGMVGVALPSFWLGLMLMLFFSVRLAWLPSTGSVSPTGLVLPVLTLSASFMAGTMRMTRSSMLDELNQDYMRTARAKGVSRSGQVVGHAFKNSLLPVITMVGMNVGSQMGGSVMTESVFSYPGIGLLLLNSINTRDTPVILGCLVLMAVSIGVCNLLSDLVMILVDPRLKTLILKGMS